MSIARVKAEYYIIFVVGIFLVALGSYWAINAVIEIIEGNQNTLILAALGAVILGFLMIRLTYQMFMPLKKNNYNVTRVCPSCGPIIETDSTICEKCKQQLD